jgi:serine phosphatase RsbU (regulator of sigma subunit)
MPGRGLALAGRLRRWPELLAVLAMLGIVFALRAALDDPAVGASYLYLVPVLFASLWFGAEGGLLAGVVAAGLYALGALYTDTDNVFLSALLRLAVFTGVGYGIGWLLDQRATLTAAVELQRRELGELRAIQEALVPSEMPERPGLDLASCYVPAVQGVAGDFFIVASGPGESTMLVVGDVLGKGIDAARRASFVRTALATFAPFSDDPVRLLEMANYSLIEKAGTSETFVTAACVTYRPDQGTATVALAGHPPPLLLDSGREVEGEPGIPLGVQVDIGSTPQTVRLERGSGLLLYTDGLIEARKPEDVADREQFGVERLQRILAEMPDEPPIRVVSEVRDAAEEFAGGALDDDLCMVALRTRP